MLNTICLILGGGQGTRLYPLVKKRSKPAVPIGAKYRMIDIPVSNCINSDMKKMFVLTQFNSASLNYHITKTYLFDQFTNGFIQVLAAEQTEVSMDWFQGTADAVRKNIMHFNDPSIDNILILSGDQIYRMDYNVLVKHMVDSSADVVVGTVGVNESDAKGFGIMKIDNRSKIVSFEEKPKEKEKLEELKLKQSQKQFLKLNDKSKNYLGSMGIYLFRKDILMELLSDHSNVDFGSDVIPKAIKTHNVSAYLFDGYWEDIGTIKSFFEANIAFASKKPPFDFYNEMSPIYTHARFLSPSKIENSHIVESLISEGCQISKADIKSSVIGLRSKVGEGSTLEKVIMMGADAYETSDDVKRNGIKHMPSIGIGKDCLLKNVIIDKNVRIGSNVSITNKKKLKNTKTELYSIRDGIVIIPKDTIIKSGTTI